MSKWFYRLSLTAFIFAAAACSFNSAFLRPDKYPQNLHNITIKTQDDTLMVNFLGVNHEPEFRKHNGRDTVNLPEYTIESVMFKDSNGDSLNGWMLKPRKNNLGITLLHLHGNAGSLLSQYRAISPLAKQGYQIFMFDYSGFGFSQGKATRANALTNALAALDYVKTRNDVKNTKLVIYGQSFGGHLAAMVAEKKQSDIDGLVIEGAFSSPKDIAAHQIPVVGRLLVKQMYAASKSIKRYHKPLLIIHSTEDEVIPFAMGQKLYALANQPKEFYEIKNKHIHGAIHYPTQISAKILAMVK